MIGIVPLCGLAAAVTVLFTGCGKKAGGPGAYQMPPPEVGVITIAPEPVALTTELPGRIDPERVAQVRARVDGIVLHRNFREGADVTNGEVLYEIDPATYKAALDSASASLTQAQQLVDRYQPLVGINAVSKQDYEEIAAVNLGYATVTAPISGRIGKALVTEGALVGQNETTELARSSSSSTRSILISRNRAWTFCDCASSSRKRPASKRCAGRGQNHVAA
jgi:membrane fusion protein, multidrug efflux system